MNLSSRDMDLVQCYIEYWCDEKLSDSRLLIPSWTSTDSRKQLIPAEYKYPCTLVLLNEAVQSAKRLNTKSPLARKDHLLDQDDDGRKWCLWPFFIIVFFIVQCRSMNIQLPRSTELLSMNSSL